MLSYFIFEVHPMIYVSRTQQSYDDNSCCSMYLVVIDANEWFFPHFQVRKTKIGTRTRKMGITCQKSSLLCCHIPRFEICAVKKNLWCPKPISAQFVTAGTVKIRQVNNKTFEASLFCWLNSNSAPRLWFKQVELKSHKLC